MLIQGAISHYGVNGTQKLPSHSNISLGLSHSLDQSLPVKTFNIPVSVGNPTIQAGLVGSSCELTIDSRDVLTVSHHQPVRYSAEWIRSGWLTNRCPNCWRAPANPLDISGQPLCFYEGNRRPRLRPTAVILCPNRVLQL